MPVISMSAGLRARSGHCAETKNLPPEGIRHPAQALVVDRSAAARQLVIGAAPTRPAPLWFEATDLPTASQLLASFDFDLVIVDPHSVDGHIGVFTGFTGRPKPAPYVVVMSEEERPQQIQEMLDAGAECHLSKHLPQAVFQTEIGNMLAELLAHDQEGPRSVPFEGTR